MSSSSNKTKHPQKIVSKYNPITKYFTKKVKCTNKPSLYEHIGMHKNIVNHTIQTTLTQKWDQHGHVLPIVKDKKSGAIQKRHYKNKHPS